MYAYATDGPTKRYAWSSREITFTHEDSRDITGLSPVTALVVQALKALALGATGVCIGRPLMTASKENGADGVRDYLTRATGELAKAMAFTGCTDLGRMDPTVIHRV